MSVQDGGVSARGGLDFAEANLEGSSEAPISGRQSFVGSESARCFARFGGSASDARSDPGRPCLDAEVSLASARIVIKNTFIHLDEEIAEVDTMTAGAARRRSSSAPARVGDQEARRGAHVVTRVSTAWACEETNPRREAHPYTRPSRRKEAQLVAASAAASRSQHRETAEHCSEGDSRPADAYGVEKSHGDDLDLRSVEQAIRRLHDALPCIADIPENVLHSPEYPEVDFAHRAEPESVTKPEGDVGQERHDELSFDEGLAQRARGAIEALDAAVRLDRANEAATEDQSGTECKAAPRREAGDDDTSDSVSDEASCTSTRSKKRKKNVAARRRRREHLESVELVIETTLRRRRLCDLPNISCGPLCLVDQADEFEDFMRRIRQLLPRALSQDGFYKLAIVTALLFHWFDADAGDLLCRVSMVASHKWAVAIVAKLSEEYPALPKRSISAMWGRVTAHVVATSEAASQEERRNWHEKAELAMDIATRAAVS